MEKSIIKIRDLTIAYNEKPVLWDLDVDFIDNSITAIVGPNGAGKSTLLKGILGLKKRLSGKIEIKGKNIKEVIKEISYIPQSSSVNWDFPTTVFDVVLMGRYIHCGWFKRPNKRDKILANEAIEKMGLEDFKDRQISQLSGGQKQRVFIARSICSDANIYFMDEPLAGVDKKTEKVIMDFLKDSQKLGKTSILVHHDLNSLERYFDHLLILNKKVIAQGKLSDVYNKRNIERAYGGDIGV